MLIYIYIYISFLIQQLLLLIVGVRARMTVVQYYHHPLDIYPTSVNQNRAMELAISRVVCGHVLVYYNAKEC